MAKCECTKIGSQIDQLNVGECIHTVDQDAMQQDVCRELGDDLRTIKGFSSCANQPATVLLQTGVDQSFSNVHINDKGAKMKARSTYYHATYYYHTVDQRHQRIQYKSRRFGIATNVNFDDL